MVESREIMTSVSRAIDAYQDWASVREVIRKPELRFFISNTTEAGIVYAAETYERKLLPQHTRRSHCSGISGPGSRENQRRTRLRRPSHGRSRSIPLVGHRGTETSGGGNSVPSSRARRDLDR